MFPLDSMSAKVTIFDELSTMITKEEHFLTGQDLQVLHCYDNTVHW